jgi:hypothetical protein
MSFDVLRAEMEKLSVFILDSEEQVLSGKMVDMSGLDREVTILCRKALSLPLAQAAEIQPLMAELIGHLERLSIALKNYRDNIKR